MDDTLYPRFERALRDLLKGLRAEFEKHDYSHIKLEIEVSGEVLHGDLKVEYILRNERYGDTVSGGDLGMVFEELRHRTHWKSRNAALCLPRVEDSETANADPAD